MRLALSLGAVFLSATASLLPQTRIEPFVPIGVWYGAVNGRLPLLSRDSEEEKNAQRDLEVIRSLGFNSVTVGVDWAAVEFERGRYEVAALDRLLAAADDAGLKVIVQVYPDVAPEWLGRRYTDANVVSEQGVKVPPQAAPGFCFDHAGVRADMSALVGEVAGRAASHRSFYALDVWSDPPPFTRASSSGPVRFCFCPHTQARFREWLRARYRTLDALNGAWRRKFTEWDQVDAPRHRADPPSTDIIDWRTFFSAKRRDDLATLAHASAARGRRSVTSHAELPAILRDPRAGIGADDDWWMATAVDHFGTSIHPKRAAGAAWSPVQLASALDGIRSATREKGWWAAEIQAGQEATALRDGAPVTGADLRLWGWAALSRGARAVAFYAWQPVAAGYGILDRDRMLTDRAKVAGEFAGGIARNAALYANLRPRASRVAVLYNPLGDTAPGGAALTQGTDRRDAMLGFYRAMFERNIQTDFLHPDDLVVGQASRYPVLYLPAPFALSQALARGLEVYVEGGGTLISEARPAWNDERGGAGSTTPGLGLDALFGARERMARSPDVVTFRMEPDLEGPLAPLSGRTFEGVSLAEHLDVTGAATRVLARFPGSSGPAGFPAIVMSARGKGRAILIGTFPSLAFEREPETRRASGELIQQLVAFAGVTPDVRIDGAPGLIEARFIESQDAMLLIAVNHDERPHKVTMTFTRDTPEAIWQNMESGAAVSFVQGPDGPAYTYSFGARDVLVLLRGKRLR